MVAAMLLTLAGTTGAAAQVGTVTCFAIADEGANSGTNGAGTQDTLIFINDALGTPTTSAIGGVEGLTSSNTEALAIKPTTNAAATNFIWAWDGQGGQNQVGTQLGLVLIDSATGAISAAPFQFPFADKIEGIHWQTFNDTDESNDVLWAITNDGTVYAFDVSGNQVAGPIVVSNATLDEGADIAVDPIDQTVYAIITNTTDTSEIVVVQGPGGPGGATVEDLEGLGFAYTVTGSTSTMVGTTGNDGGSADNFYTIDRASGAAALAGSIAAPGADHEDVDCVNPLIPVRGSVGDRLFTDSNTDGQQNPGEPGVVGEVVNLWTSDAAGNPTGGAPIATTTTGADGAYLFTGVPVGTYVVQFPNVAAFTAANVGPDGSDSDVNPATGITGPVTLTAVAPDNLTIDGGALPAPSTVTIGNRVFLDRGLDGDQTGDPGVTGVTVNLWTADAAGNPTGGAPVATTTTGAGGVYQFTGQAPGTYVVQVIDPSGAGFTTANAVGDTVDSDVDAGGISDPITLTGLAGSRVNNTLDAGLIPLVTIGDRVWRDSNRDGSQNNGEGGIPNVTVNLWTADAAGNPTGGAPVATTTTDNRGKYSFVDFPAGTYVVQVIDPFGFGFTGANAVGDTIDSDVDAAGISDPVTLTGAAGSIVDNTIDAGVWDELATIGDRLFVDSNANGTQDAGEPGIPGETIQLVDAAGSVVDTTTTDGAGLYLFEDLPRGGYGVQFPAGLSYTIEGVSNDATNSDADATTGLTRIIFLESGDDNRDLDAGVLPDEPPVGIGALGNRLWVDRNEDGQQDFTGAAAEPGIGGATVNLWTSDAAGNPTGGAPIASTTTAPNGVYNFTGLQLGTYVVQFPGGLDYTVQDTGGDTFDSDANPATGITGPYTLTPANPVDNTVDAGVRPEGALVTIGNRVWEDTDGDGSQAGEPGISGATVNLWTSDAAGNPTGGAPIATTTTGAGGIYQFTNQQPGTYVVQVIDPIGAGFTIANAAADTLDSDVDAAGITDPVTLTGLPGSIVDNTLDAGVLSDDDDPTLVTIGNRVWIDSDSDGSQVGEAGIPGVTVNLWTADAAGNPTGGAPIATTTTGAGGIYQFTNQLPGTYVVQVIDPVGNGFTVANAANDSLDSDVDAAGISDPITLTGAPGSVVNNTLDAGLAPGTADFMVMSSVRCLGGNGVVTTEIINKSGSALAYSIMYPEPGHPLTPAQVAAGETAVINRGGRPDGPYTYDVTVDGVTQTLTVVVDCDAAV